MADVKKISTYEIGNTDTAANYDTLDAVINSYHQVSLTEMDTTTVPKVAANSVFGNNGALYEVEADATIGGSPSDGKVFIYFDVSALAFVFSNTMGTWSDLKQGFYDSNDRYLLFIMTKLGSSYSSKRRMLLNNEMANVTLEDGADGDRNLQFTSTARIGYDLSDNEFDVVGNLATVGNFSTTGSINRAAAISHIGIFTFDDADTGNDVYDSLDVFFSEFSSIILRGGYGLSGTPGSGPALTEPWTHATKSGTTITCYNWDGGSFAFTDGSGTTLGTIFGTPGVNMRAVL